MTETRFTREYGVGVPVISAGMAFVARAPLVAAVSAAGGFGVLGATGMPHEVLASDLDAIRAATTNPFGVNLIPRFADTGHVELCAQAKVASVTFFWDDPDDAWVAMLHDAGVKVWVQVGSADQARAAVGRGADAVIAQGLEAGGHNLATLSTMVAVPTIVDAVPETLVFAAGGIADARGVAAVLALGADAAMMGTRFVAAAEADAHPEYQRRIIAAEGEATSLNNIFGFDFPNARVRGLRNQIVQEFTGHDDPPPYAASSPEQQPVIGATTLFGAEMPLARFMGMPPVAAAEGDFEQMSLLAGESVAGIDRLQTAAEILAEIERSLGSPG